MRHGTADRERPHANGADATDDYPCGESAVKFTSMDASGNVAVCRTRVIVSPPGPPPRVDVPLLAVKSLPGDVVWSFVAPPSPAVSRLHLYVSDRKSVPVASRSLVFDLDPGLTAYLDAGAIPAPPALAFDQLVTSGCDNLTESGY